MQGLNVQLVNNCFEVFLLFFIVLFTVISTGGLYYLLTELLICDDMCFRFITKRFFMFRYKKLVTVVKHSEALTALLKEALDKYVNGHTNSAHKTLDKIERLRSLNN